MSTYAQRVLTGGFPYPLWPFGPSPPDRGSRPQTPKYGGRPPESRALSSGGQNLSGVPLLPPGHWALKMQNLVKRCAEITPPILAKPGQLGFCGEPNQEKCLRCTDTAWPGIARGDGRCSVIAGGWDIRPYTQNWQSLRRGRCLTGPPDSHRTKRVGRHQAGWGNV